jgi:phage tail-like protein
MTNNGSGVSHVADPEGNFIFALEIDGIEVAQFLECSGLKSATEVFELQEGGMNHRVHKLPGQSRWENIILRSGVTNDVSLLQWRGEILSDEFGSGSRRNGSVVVKNNQMEVVRRYNFVDAWPVGWEGPTLSSSAAELAIEVIELAHHGIYVS